MIYLVMYVHKDTGDSAAEYASTKAEAIELVRESVDRIYLSRRLPRPTTHVLGSTHYDLGSRIYSIHPQPNPRNKAAVVEALNMFGAKPLP